jgi:transposase
MRGLQIRGDRDAVELRQYAEHEPDRRAALRALAIASALEGASRAEAARLVGRDRQALRDAVVRYNAEGLTGLHDRPGRGQQPRLTQDQQSDLKAWVVKGPDPEQDGMSTYRLIDIAAHIEAKWGVTYTASAVSKLLRRMKLSWQKARPSHPQGDAQVRESFKKTSQPTCKS